MVRKILLVLFASLLSSQAAIAANCTSYPLPYTLTNGQTADASQVMANFNNVINCVNSLSAVTGPASSVAGHIATFADTTGKVIQDGGPFTVSPQNLANAAVAFGVNMLNGTIVASNAGNALTLTIQTLAGATPSASDPVIFVFRSATPGSGNYSVISVTAALSVTIPTSSTLGFSNNVPGRIWLTAINNAGAVELAVINCLTSTATSKTIYPLGGWGIASTTALGGPSNSGGVLYSTIARSSVPYSVLGYVTYESGLATAGTWNANPTNSQLFGPSVRKPGDVVQTVMGSSTTNTTTTAGPTTTNVSASITPTSAANLIKARSNGSMTITFGGGGNIVGTAQIYRGTTAVGIAVALSNSSASNSMLTPWFNEAFDAPGSTSSQTYAVKITSGNAGVTVGFPTTNGGQMTLDEIMN